MSKAGIKIKNIQAGSIYERNLGVRDNLDMKDAVQSHSLFLDFLLNNGLRVWKGESTRDIIAVDFSYGSRSYEEDMKHLQKIGNEDLIAKCEANRDKYDKKSKQELRTMFYTDGVSVTYDTHNKSGEIIKSETIHYQMLYRTPGKAKVGKVMFICDRLFKKSRDFLYMGIKLPKKNAPIVEIGAYSSLITSSVENRIKIDPDEILIMKDVDSLFTTNIVSVELNERNECVAVPQDNYTLKNTLFDGQALIDSSIFPTWGNGYVLLRHHMTKMAAFCTHIQQYFKDYYGDQYNTATITDMFGTDRCVKDIKLITTENAIKWLKFGVSFDYWAEWVRKNGCMFGVVKTAHQSKLGDVQRMSYQMVNTLDLDSMDEVMQTSVDYIHQLKTDDEVFLQYLRQNVTFSNDYEVLLALVKQDPDFILSEYFRERRRKIINTYIINMKTGKLIQNGDNLVIVGNPYAMLMCAVGLNPEDDPTFEQEDGTIQCWTARFNDGEYLAGFRSPFNSRNNMDYLHNHYHQYIDQYFNLGRQVIAVNLIHTDFQDRNNGSDQDSDSVYVTNHQAVVSHAQYCYLNYPTIVNNISQDKNTYTSSLEDFARVDHNLSKSQLAIGESSNLAQIALSYSYTFDDPKYKDAVCILSVVAQMAIDNAKRTFACDIPAEIRRIKKDIDLKGNGYPAFWRLIRPDFNRHEMINKQIKCPMNYLNSFRDEVIRDTRETLPMDIFFMNYEMKEPKRKSRKVEDLIQKYAFKLYQYNADEDQELEKYLLLRDDFDDMVQDIRRIHISNNYLGLMSWLVNRAFLISDAVKKNDSRINSILSKNRAILFKVLYDISPIQFLQIFSKNTSKSVHLDMFDT